MLDAGGEYAWRVRGEEHAWTPDVIAKLQQSARQNSYSTYKEYAALINDQSRRQMTLRRPVRVRFRRLQAGAAGRKSSRPPRSSSASRPARCRSARSPPKRTRCSAIAMNRIGGKSNTGEGGEDRRRYAPVKAGETMQSRLGAKRVEVDIPLQAGDSLKSKIKQVASGRFGVTAEVPGSAEMLQIKIAQGAKPGEGGQLPARRCPNTSPSCAIRRRASS
jgi:glutamate synthase domain-containing protein 2